MSSDACVCRRMRKERKARARRHCRSQSSRWPSFREVCQVTTRGGARQYAPRRWQFDPKIAAHLQSVHLWWPAVAKLQAASMPIAWAAAPWDRWTDASHCSKMPTEAGHSNTDTHATV